MLTPMKRAPYLASAIATFVMVLSVTNWAAAQATQTFTSSQYGYSVDFPADWKRIPDADVKKAESMIHARSPSSSITWEAVYQEPGGTHSFQYPYVILQVLPYTNGRQLRDTEIEQTVNQMTGNNVRKIAGTTGNKAIDDALQGASFGSAQYDSSNRVVYQTIDMSAPGVGSVKGLTVGHFGRNAMVSVMCYDLSGSIDGSKPTLNRISASFRFDKDSAYDPSQAGLFSIAFSGAARGALIGGLVGVVCAAFVVLFRRKKARV